MSKLGCLNCIFCEPKYTLALKCTCDTCHVGTLFEVSPRHRFYCTVVSCKHKTSAKHSSPTAGTTMIGKNW